MNELLQLLGLVDSTKKDEAQKLTDLISAKITQLDNEINTQEKIKLEAIKSRDDIKAKLKDIGLKLGINAEVDNVADAIDLIKSKKGVDKTEALEIKEKEIEQLKTEIQTLSSTLSTVKESSQQDIMNVIMERDLALILPKYKAREELSKYMIQDIKQLAKYENGKLVFKKEDGTTYRINGADATLEDLVKEKREAEVKSNRGVFFDIEVQNSGAGNQGGNPTSGDFIP